MFCICVVIYLKAIIGKDPLIRLQFTIYRQSNKLYLSVTDNLAIFIKEEISIFQYYNLKDRFIIKNLLIEEEILY